MTTCLWCDRVCPRCEYFIEGGWEHIPLLQGPGSNFVLCRLRRVHRPLAEALSGWFGHRHHREAA